LALEVNVHTEYGQRNDRELEALWALETGIAGIAAQFRDEHAFNFSHEIEIAAYLMVSTREAFGTVEPVGRLPVHLTRMEWRCLDNRDIDLVLIHPDAVKKAREGWGTTRSKIAKTLPLLAAVQIKRGGGNVTPLNQVQKDLQDLGDINSSTSLGKPVSYFLAWIDSSLKRRPHHVSRYRAVKAKLEAWCDELPQNRRAFLLSRDRVGCAFPKEAWLAQPLPPGTVEDPVHKN